MVPGAPCGITLCFAGFIAYLCASGLCSAVLVSCCLCRQVCLMRLLLLSSSAPPTSCDQLRVPVNSALELLHGTDRTFNLLEMS